MKHIEWDSSNDTGIPAIDSQHRQLLLLLNMLGKATDGNEPDEKLIAILARFVDSNELHFSSEERFMAGMSYPGLDDHKKEHANLMSYVRHLQGNLMSKQEAFTPAIMLYLAKWLDNHLKTADAAYVEFIQVQNKKSSRRGLLPLA